MQGLDPLKNVEQFYCQTVVFFNRVKPLGVLSTVARIAPSQQLFERRHSRRYWQNVGVAA